MQWSISVYLLRDALEPLESGFALSDRSGDLPEPASSGTRHVPRYLLCYLQPLFHRNRLFFQTQPLVDCLQAGTLLNSWKWRDLLPGTLFRTSIESGVQTLHLVQAQRLREITHALIPHTGKTSSYPLPPKCWPCRVVLKAPLEAILKSHYMNDTGQWAIT